MFEELSLNVLDIAMNSLAAKAATVEVTVLESRKRNWLILRVRDNGHGMDAATMERVLRRRTTSKTSRKKNIGLGLALLRQTSEMCGGHFHMRSAIGKGTSVTASIRLDHIDRPPLGDLTSTILTLSAANPNTDVRLNYRTDTEEFHFSSQEPTLKGKGNP
jgi:K+-sensing histidine kinase KdpD